MKLIKEAKCFQFFEKFPLRNDILESHEGVESPLNIPIKTGFMVMDFDWISSNSVSKGI